MKLRYILAVGLVGALSACASVEINNSSSSTSGSSSVANSASTGNQTTTSTFATGLDYGAESALPPALDDPLGPGNWLNSEEISRALVGPEFRYAAQIRGNDLSGLIQLLRGGEISIKTDSGQPDYGRWRIVEDNACLRLALGFGGQEVCMSVRDDGRGRYTTSVGFDLQKLF